MILRPHGTIVLLSRLLGVSVILIGLFGCANSPVPRAHVVSDTRPMAAPPVHEKASYGFIRFAGDKKKALLRLRKALDTLIIYTAREEIDKYDGRYEIITEFKLEDSQKDALRIKRYMYKFNINTETPAPKNICSEISIAWVTESKAIKGDRWSEQPSDRDHIPESWSKLKQALEDHPCK